MYDKTTDPYRVTENVVRAEIAALNNAGRFPGDIHLVKQGKFTPGGDGTYASVEAVCLRDDAPDPDRPFSVHTVVLKAEAEGVQGVVLINGRYDMTVEQAAEAL